MRGDRFALYLRDYREPSQATFSLGVGFAGPVPLYGSPIEEAVVSALRMIPVYSFYNENDVSLGGSLRVFSSDSKWFADFCRYATEAILLVLDYNCILNKGFRDEITWIVRQGFGDKTLLLVSSDGLNDLKEKYPHIDMNVRWVLLVGRDRKELVDLTAWKVPTLELPESLLGYLNENDK